MGDRSAPAGGGRLHHCGAERHHAGRRMAQARLRAGLRALADRRGTGDRGFTALTGGHLWARLSDAEKLLRAEGLQLLGSLRAVRRPSERPYRRRAAVPDAVEQERATQDQRCRIDAAAADRAWTL